jgi:signal transduction histidine kinase
LFKHQSGRVIALGRAILAALFLLAIWLDPTQRAPADLYLSLIGYMIFAAGLALVTWRSWWFDARLAVPAHVIDMLIFAEVVFSASGYTSPFFLVFMLPLLSAAIRWGWRETALTAAILVVVFFSAGTLVTHREGFELQRFIVRTAHLAILSAILIWFGVHQRFTNLFVSIEDVEASLSEDDAIHGALRLAMRAAGAGSGLLLLRAPGEHRLVGGRIDGSGYVDVAFDHEVVRDEGFGSTFLFDSRKNRALSADRRRHMRFSRGAPVLSEDALRELGLAEGVITVVQTGTGEGWLVLQAIPDLSTDYLDLGREIGRAAGAVIERHALLAATAEGAAAQTRLTLARDVHDGIIQFLAGATFRLEAISRAAKGGAKIDDDLQDLKGLMVEEQRDIRAFLVALRRNRELELGESVEELRTLAARLSQQWSVKCKVEAKGEEAQIPIRLQLDLQQLLREAVANAVRHGQASEVDVQLGVTGDQLRFDVSDNGSGFTLKNGKDVTEPWSLRERVDRAQGTLMLVSRPGRTDISIRLPLSGSAA